MAEPDPDMLEIARQARDTIASQLLTHPDVSLIDVGYDPEDNSIPRRLVVRIHARKPLDLKALGIPMELNRIPIRVIHGDYRLE